jgi:Family of unknown function (DUF5985)
MAVVIYVLCAATSVLCAWLLLRAYARTKFGLLFWSGLCFVGLSINNLLLVVDTLVPAVPLLTWRLVAALVALLLLLFGLIWEEK